MGLDGVELVLNIEEAFNIKIEDDDIAQVITVGELHDYLVRNISGIRHDDCPTVKAFYRLRKTLQTILPLRKKDLRPSTAVLNLLPVFGRIKIWRKLEKEISLRLPPLQSRSGKGVAWGVGIAVIAGFFITLAMTGDIFAAFGSAIIGMLPGCLIGYIVGVFCVPTLCPQHQTLGGLARGIVAYNYTTFIPKPPSQAANDQLSEQTWNKLCDLIVQQMPSIKRSQIHRETKFADDLGF